MSDARVVSDSIPNLKDVLTKALNEMPDKNGTKAEILAMAATLYPKISNDSYVKRSLENAFSKYLEAAPVRIMLLHVSE